MSDNGSAGDDDAVKAAGARALHSLLFGTAVFCLVYVAVGAPLLAVRKAVGSAIVAALLAVTLGCMFLLRRGRVRLSSWIFLGAAWLALVNLVVLSGGISSPALMGPIAVTVVSVWLVGRRAAIGLAALFLSFLLAIAVLEAAGVHMPRYFSMQPIGAWAMAAALINLAILPLATVSQSLVDSARESRRELEARRQEERARAESEERFRSIFLHAAVGIAQTSIDGRFLLSNGRFCGFLGYGPAEMERLTFLDVTHPEERAENQAVRSRMIAGEIRSWSTEKRYIRKDGATAWARLDLSLVRDPEGAPRYFIAVVDDISQRIQTEQALRASERRLALALRAARMNVWDCDLKDDEIVVSTKYREVHQRDPRSRAEWLTLVHPDDRERILSIASDSIEGARQWDAEFRVVLPNAGIRWMHAFATTIVDEAEQPAHMVGVSQDITERKQAEALLRESEERFRNMADTAPVMIWMAGPDKGCTFVNRTWLNFTGRTLEQELGLGWADAVHPDDRERHFAVFSAAFEVRRPVQAECRWRRADGEYRLVLCTGIPRFTPDGEFAGYIGSKIDITDLQSEMRFRQLAENIDQVFWMLDLGMQRVLYVSPAFEKVGGSIPPPCIRIPPGS
jgi:PAS domain S-box-containing protein